MALVICPECQKQISDRAKACPNCGFPMEEYIKSNEENKTPEPVDEIEAEPIDEIEAEPVYEIETEIVDEIENLICPKCGADYYKGAKFCRKCGNPLIGTVESAPVSDIDNKTIETVSADVKDNIIIVNNVENQKQENTRSNSTDDISDEEKQKIADQTSKLKKDIEDLADKMGIPPRDFIPIPNEPCEAPSNVTVLKNEMQRLLNYFSERTIDFQMYKKFLGQLNNLWEGGQLLFACAVGGFMVMVAFLFIYEMSSDNKMGLLMEWLLFILFTVVIYIPAKKSAEKKKAKLTNDLMFLRKNLIWHYNKATRCFISFDHCDPDIISAMYNNLLSGRANSYASALNVYLSDETTRMMIQRMNEQFEKMDQELNRMQRQIRRDMNNRRY